MVFGYTYTYTYGCMEVGLGFCLSDPISLMVLAPVRVERPLRLGNFLSIYNFCGQVVPSIDDSLRKETLPTIPVFVKDGLINLEHMSSFTRTFTF